MPGTSFKNYVVNYDLVVNSTASEGFSQVAQMAQRMQKPLKDISNHFKRLQQSANALKKSGAFEMTPTINLATFDKQSKALVTKAESVAAQINGILNSAFSVTPVAAKASGGKSPSKPGKSEIRTFTKSQLQKEADDIKKQLRNLYGPRGAMSSGAKGYKTLVESLGNDAAKLGVFKNLRSRLDAVNKDIKAAAKNNGKIKKTISNGIAQGVAGGTKKAASASSSKNAFTSFSNSIAQTSQRLQSLANTKSINLNTKLIANGQTGFDLNSSIARLQQLALSRPIKLDVRVIPTGQAGYDLNASIARLQQIAATKPIKLNTVITPSATGAKGVGKSSVGNTVPVEGVVNNVTVSKSVKVAGGPIKVEGVIQNAGLAKNAKINIPSVTRQVNELKELSSIWKQLPKTGSRTYTVNLKILGAENIGMLRELSGIVGTLPPSQRRTYSGSVGANKGTSTMIGTLGRRTPSSAWRQRKASMNGFGYQLMGNTSLGARTPVFLDMMKGMGMMTGVGAAMSTLTDAFSNASEYQNTMVTAKSILEANYNGGNFNRDFGNMERIVRDVAKKTKFTAPQAADAARFMAMAGLNIPMINASIRPIADVAVIGDNDLGEVADKITNIQTAFGIKPEKMRALADALTKTFTSSNTDMMMLAESMEYAAPMAHLAGAKVEDALAMIGIMGNAGIQGSMAGTTLRMMYQNVINPNKKQAKMWESLGISLKDQSGNPRQLIDILGDLRKKVRVGDSDKDENGKFKDEGTPIASAVSKLFRVTASAGAGTLLENLDKVIALAEANRNANGLSQRISEVKQNDVKGMWAKMTSAFTDAVVSEFEKQDNPIKGYLSNITKYFNSGEFKSLLHDLFDLVTSMMDMLGQFVKIWRGIYNTFGPIIKYTMMAQFILAQIGYLFAPLRSVWMALSKGAGALGGITAGSSMFGSAILGGSGTPVVSGAPGKLAVSSGMYATPAILAARNNAAQIDRRLLNSQKYLAAANAANAATSPAIQRSIEKKQMQWLVASNLVGSGAALRASDNRAGRWNLAYTNPQAASELPNRFKIMSAREKEIAALQGQLSARNKNIAMAEAAMIANTSSSIAAHRELNNQIANVRHANRVVSADVLNRAVQMNKISRGGAMGMSFANGFRNAATWGMAGFSMANIVGSFTRITGVVGKALGFLVNPITIVVGALTALSVAAWKAHSKMVEMNTNLQNEALEFGNKTREMANEFKQNDNLSNIFEGIKAISIDTATVNINREADKFKPISVNEDLKEFYNTLLTKYDIRSGEPFLDRSVQDSTIKSWYEQYVAPMSGLIPGIPGTLEEFRSRGGGGGRAGALGMIDVVRSIHGAQGYQDALESQKEINRLYSELLGFDDATRRKLTPEYITKINDIVNSYNPANQKLAQAVTATNIQQMARALPTEDIAYYQAAYNALRGYTNNSNVVNAINQYNRMKDAPPLPYETNAWNNIFTGMAAAVPFKLHGEKGEFSMTLPLDSNGIVQKDKFMANAVKQGKEIINPDELIALALNGIYTQMEENIPGFRERANAVGFTQQAFVRHSMPSNTFGWGLPLLPSQKDYAYTNATQQGQTTGTKPINVTIQKIEINPTMKEEVDTEKMSMMITEGFADRIDELIHPRWGQY